MIVPAHEGKLELGLQPSSLGISSSSYSDLRSSRHSEHCRCGRTGQNMVSIHDSKEMDVMLLCQAAPVRLLICSSSTIDFHSLYAFRHLFIRTLDRFVTCIHHESCMSCLATCSAPSFKRAWCIRQEHNGRMKVCLSCIYTGCFDQCCRVIDVHAAFQALLSCSEKYLLRDA